MADVSAFEQFCNGGCAVSNDFRLFISSDCTEANFINIPCSPEDASDWTMSDGKSKQSTITMKGCNNIVTYSPNKEYESREFTFLLSCTNLYEDDFYKYITGLKSGDMFIVKREFTLPDGTVQTLFRPYTFGSFSEKFQGDSSSQVMGFSIEFTPLADGAEECPECDDKNGGGNNNNVNKSLHVDVKEVQ